jgi:hypothetical protein
MNAIQSFDLKSARYAQQLRPLPPPQAFEQTADLLQGLQVQSPPELLSGVADSRQLKEQFFAQVSQLNSVPHPDAVRQLSLQALAAGLLCGALDGALLYQLAVIPDAVGVPSGFEAAQQSMQATVTLADQQWRAGDADGLQLQSGYGKHINRRTDDENVAFLAQPGKGHRDAQRAFVETFRTGYSLGLIDSAIVFVTGQRPDPLQPES